MATPDLVGNHYARAAKRKALSGEEVVLACPEIFLNIQHHVISHKGRESKNKILLKYGGEL